MIRLKRILRRLTLIETRQPSVEAAPGKSDAESEGGQTSLPAGFVRPTGPYSSMGDKQTAMSALTDLWQKRKSGPPKGRRS